MLNTRDNKEFEDHAVRRRYVPPVATDLSNPPSSEHSMEFINESKQDEGVIDDDFTARTYNYDELSDEEILPSAEESMHSLNLFASMNHSNIEDVSVQFGDTYDNNRNVYDSDSEEEKVPLSSTQNFADILNEVSLIAHPQSDLFKKLAIEIHSKGAADYSDLLELPDYKSHKLVIYQGLQELGIGRQHHPAMIAAVFLAHENALHIARAIRHLVDHDMFTSPLTISMQIAQSFIDAGKDAELIAKAITEFNDNHQTSTNSSFNLEKAITYIHLLLKLKQAGIILTDNLCLVIAKVSESIRQEVIESLITLQAAEKLTDHLYLTLALYDQYQNSKCIADLLIVLKDKIPLTEEIINLVIMNGSHASEIIEDIKQLTEEPSVQNIKAIIKSRNETSVSSTAEATLTLAQLELKNAGIPLTDNLRRVMKKSDAFFYGNTKVIAESVIALEKAGIATEHFLLSLALRDKYTQLIEISNLLILLKNTLERPLSNEFIDLVLKCSAMMPNIYRGIKKLLNNKIKSSVELITALYTCYDVAESTDILRLLLDNNMLPNVMRMEESEMKLPVLSSHAVINMVKYKQGGEGCKVLLQHRDEIELIDDLILQSIFSATPAKMPDIFKAYLDLKRSDYYLSEDQINDIAIAILSGNGKNYMQQLVKTYYEEVSALMTNDVMVSRNLIPPLWNCVYSYFHTPPTVCKVELIADDVAESKLEAPKVTANGPSYRRVL